MTGKTSDMEQFDQFFNKKFQDRHFELNEAHWQAAQEMIAREEKKKRRRRLFFWLFGGVLLLGLVGVGWWASHSGNSDSAVAVSTEIPKAQADDQTEHHHSAQTENSYNSKLPADQTALASNRRDGQNNNTRSEANFEKTNTNYPIKSKLPLNQELYQIESTIQPYEKLITDSLDQAFSTQKEKSDETGVYSAVFIESLILEPLFSHTENPMPDLPEVVIPDKAETNENPSFLGADFNIELYPYFEREVKQYLGMKFGLSYGFPLDQRFSLIYALNYQQRGGTFDFFKESSKVAYRFAKTEERFKLLPEKLHYLEASTILAWEEQQHSLEAGLGLNYLLGIRGQLLQFSGADNFESSTVAGSGWIVEDGFKKWHLTAILGYSWRFSSKVGVGMRFHYVPGTILDKNYEFSEVFLRENQSLGMELRLRYYFF